MASPASGHVGTCPLAFERILFARLDVVWFGFVLCQTLNLAPFLQLYSLWNDTITGYNGACAKVNNCFYRATLCISAVFAVGRCLSATFAYCIQMAEDIIKQVFRPGRAIILFFFGPKRRYPIPKGARISLDAKYTEVVKICDFD